MSTQDSSVYVSLEFTPNPNTLKYSVNRKLLDTGAANFVDPLEAEKHSPLAFRLFQVPGIRGVMIGTDFVTVTKAEDGDWDVVHKGCSRAVEQHLTENRPVISDSFLERRAHGGGDSAVESKIREILDQEVRPAVAMDGGDITFERYEAGVVYLHMVGSCAGCPSSTATLKQGIETRLKAAIPEVLEVVAV